MTDDAALIAAFEAHTAGQTKFTRRMAINIGDHFGMTPKQAVTRLEQLKALKDDAWSWFRQNGGITRAHVAEARADRTAGTP